MERRTFLAAAAAPLVAGVATSVVDRLGAQTPAKPAGKLKQSVMASVWTGSTLSFEDRCKTLARIGFKGMDLPTEQQVPILRQYGLAPAMMTGTGTSFQDGLIRKEIHSKIEDATHAGIDMCARVGCGVLIAIPGEKRGMSREEGADNAVAILSRVKSYAEQKNVTVCMEITNSKVAADSRTDQVFNHLDWGFDVIKRVNSPRVKILFDMYHVQIMEGDLTRTFKDNLDKICHVHVAGVPTRMEIDETQELNYRFVAKTIADSGYNGFVAHEWRAAMGNDPIKSLEKCFEIMNV